jgi:hypothetical protein
MRFPGIAARVIEPPPGIAPAEFPYLVETLFLRSRWWVNKLGEPQDYRSPLMMTPAGRAALIGRRPILNARYGGARCALLSLQPQLDRATIVHCIQRD